ncbi:hypothetical protein [Streptomyces collinus]|uniref:hypothetical protein n=1 Tax=Streptomyces collinus TaxID=42684 RepID=UPI0036E83DA0
MLIADAATGRREREVDANRLHAYPTRSGEPRRTGYALADTHDGLTLLTERALRAYPYAISGSASDQDARRGRYLRLQPDVSVQAVWVLVSTLEAAARPVEPAATVADELRVRYRGMDRCPSPADSPRPGNSVPEARYAWVLLVEVLR